MAWYKNGTVAVTNSSPTITGTGTVWLTQIKAGDIFTIDKQRQYEILTVNSDTSITLAENYVGSTASGQSYAIMRNFTDGYTADVCSRVLNVMTKYNTLADASSGGSGTAGTTTNTLTRGTGLTGNNFNGSAATTWNVDSATANTPSKIVARDASGNFSANVITAALNGNAASATQATKLATPRTINGVYFDGSQNITITASGGTSSGTTTTVINATSTVPRGNPCGVIIPFYFYPTDVYNSVGTNTVVLATVDVIKKYRQVPTIVVLNPQSGAGAATDGNYVVAAKMFKAAGACVVGYIASNYSGTITPFRTEAQVKAEIDKWATLYATAPIDGIFIDEMSNTSNASQVALYRRYKDYCYSKGYYPVIGNPGANCAPDYFQNGGAVDIVLVHENSTDPDENAMKGFSSVNHPIADSHYEYPTSMRGILWYAKSSVNSGQIRRFKQYVDWIYCTNDTFPTLADNPWDNIPSATYLEQLYAALADTGSSGGGATLLTSGASVSWDASYTDLGTFTIGTTATMAAATGMIAGRTYTLIVTQDATGNRSLSFNTFYKFASGVTLPVTGTAGKKHVIEFIFDGTNALAKSVTTI